MSVIAGRRYAKEVLRRLNLLADFRSLGIDSWPSDLPLGSRTVIYGHNGSGKSTLAELLLSLAESSSATAVEWEHHDKRTTRVDVGGAAPFQLEVFTRRWVRDNLSAFLDGASASAIVTLGRDAIEARQEERDLNAQIDKGRESLLAATEHHKSLIQQAEKIARGVQERIVEELRVFDYQFYTKNRFSINRVQSDLRSFSGDVPESAAHSSALQRLGEGALVSVPDIQPASVETSARLDAIAEHLLQTPTRVALEALDAAPTAQRWVESGLALHESLETCLFCGGDVTDQRRAQLARHFDESWLRLRGDATELLEAVTRDGRALTAWMSGLPDARQLASDLQDDYTQAGLDLGRSVQARRDTLDAIAEALRKKIDDPSAVPDAPDWSALRSDLPIDEIRSIVAKHNEQAFRNEELTASQKRTVISHLVGSASAQFNDLEAQVSTAAQDLDNQKEKVKQAVSRLAEVRQARFTTKRMADTLTLDLARVYGKNHLTIAVTDDGKSYAVRRGEHPGTDLSEGERMTLSLLYFLRKLEDEETTSTVQDRIVVIDDPSSSLDRESLFATHQWLADSLKPFGQYIVLTHDFSLLRLFLKSHKNAWGKSMKQIDQGNDDEVAFPKVAFLEMHASTNTGRRRSQLGRLPRLLLNNTTEYAYLFSMVMAGVSEDDENDRLFLLPNAARRLLEVFSSYKAPHRTDFLQALETLVASQEGEPYRDVYDFCNRHSHGEGSESVDVLDARAVHGQIRRCMQFLRAVDREHFERMCTATNVDPAILP